MVVLQHLPFDIWTLVSHHLDILDIKNLSLAMPWLETLMKQEAWRQKKYECLYVVPSPHNYQIYDYVFVYDPVSSFHGIQFIPQPRGGSSTFNLLELTEGWPISVAPRSAEVPRLAYPSFFLIPIDNQPACGRPASTHINFDMPAVQKLLRAAKILDLSNTNITNEDLHLVRHAHTLNLSDTDVSDASCLKDVHTLNLANTLVTDVDHLGSTHTLNLNGTDVSDISALGDVHTLFLDFTQVTDFTPLLTGTNVHYTCRGARSRQLRFD